MKYSEFKAAQSAAISAFPIAWAFSQSQLAEAMEKLGVKDQSELAQTYGGGLIRKTDAQSLRDLHARQSVERSEFLADPANLKSALVYELSNHEYCITYDHSSALSALGLRSSELSSDQWDILKDAKTKYLEGCE